MACCTANSIAQTTDRHTHTERETEGEGQFGDVLSITNKLQHSSSVARHPGLIPSRAGPAHPGDPNSTSPGERRRGLRHGTFVSPPAVFVCLFHVVGIALPFVMTPRVEEQSLSRKHWGRAEGGREGTREASSVNNSQPQAYFDLCNLSRPSGQWRTVPDPF